MRRVLLVGAIILAAACHERLGPNDLVVPAGAKVGVGTPVYNGTMVVGRVVRAQPRGEQVRLTFTFASDSAAPSSLTDLRLRSSGLGSSHVFVVAPPSVVPVFGPGGPIPGAARRR